MPVEPPVTSPASLADAYAAMAEAPVARPVAGGTDLLVALTGELGEPPARTVDLWRLDELRGIDPESRDDRREHRERLARR